MNDNVVPFGKAKGEQTEENGPYWVGACFCGACGHEWQGTAPVGDEDYLECPSCHRMWGSSKNMVVPSTATWKCLCGESLFWLTPEGAMCRRCGNISSDWAE